ncbi:phosphatidylglycerophosphatase A [Moraxella sp. ZJ142]|uniref:phosphatidylglycerophosphatase A family protein n=1 Tax=Moraxella marmotae TaxID=3344520 RepID=UPI0035D4DBBD
MNNQKPDIFKANTCPPCPPSASGWQKLIYWLGIGLGSGRTKKAPGTWGTLGGLVVALPMFCLGFWGFLAITVIGCLVGGYICGTTSRLMNVHDDPHIVWDEWVGMWIALLPTAFVLSSLFTTDKDGQNWGLVFLVLDGEFGLVALSMMLILPFLLFRFFDIIKPFPISWADKKVSGGFGIMLDDILAGIMAAIIILLMVAVAFA